MLAKCALLHWTHCLLRHYDNTPVDTLDLNLRRIGSLVQFGAYRRIGGNTFIGTRFAVGD